MSAADFIQTDPGWRDPDDALRDLLERQQQILAMQETEGWALWRDFLIALSGGYQHRLLAGTHKDLLDYKFDAGVVKGIRLALDATGILEGKVSATRRILDESKPYAEQDAALAMEDTE